MKTGIFDYDLHPELIAQDPLYPRHSSRLMVVRSGAGSCPGAAISPVAPSAAEQGIEHALFRDLPRYLEPGDLLILNRTKVIRARLLGRKAGSGGRVEVLLLRPAGPMAAGGWEDADTWETLCRPGGRVRPGTELLFGEAVPDVAAGAPARATAQPASTARLAGTVVDRTPAGGRVIAFRTARPGETFAEAVESLGEVPLPPYITKPLGDPDRYQTIYASASGSVAAPTAGLHFTGEIMELLSAKGVRKAFLTLHIGLDTFRPVREDRVENHQMHTEWYDVPPETAEAVEECRTKGGRVVACGTTAVRALEAAADPARPGLVRPSRGETSLFIYPGYRFGVVDVILTNFHLPRSTLLMLVSAFAGTETVLAAYQAAIDRRYRFYSFGDAMLVFPEVSREGKEGRS